MERKKRWNANGTNAKTNPYADENTMTFDLNSNRRNSAEFGSTPNISKNVHTGRKKFSTTTVRRQWRKSLVGKFFTANNDKGFYNADLEASDQYCERL